MAEQEKKTEWQETTSRFVLFLDIMGFKDMVERNKHEDVVSKLRLLKKELELLEGVGKVETFKYKDSISESRSITFSDSIILFSKSDTTQDACKIIMDAFYLISIALEYGIGIKGALSYGEITVDFKNSLFFGRPIIDAYLLHDSLQMYSCVVDNRAEKKINSLIIESPFSNHIVEYKANFKTGKINHKLIRPLDKKDIDEQIEFILKLKDSVSGSPRIYIDNTLEFLNSLLPKEKNASGEKPSQ